MHTAAVGRGVPRAWACENLALHSIPSRTGYPRVACSVRLWWGTKEKGMSYARTHGTSHIQEASYRGRGARRIARRENVCARSAIVAGPITFAHLIRRRRVRRASIDSERRTEGRASCAHRNHSAFERLRRMDRLREMSYFTHLISRYQHPTCPRPP